MYAADDLGNMLMDINSSTTFLSGADEAVR